MYSLVRIWTRRILCVVATITGLLASIILAGALIPSIPVIGAIGTIFEGMLTLQVELLAFVALVAALLAKRLGARRFMTGITVLSTLAVLAGLVPLGAFIAAARNDGASISWGEQLSVMAPGGRATPAQTKIFAVLNGRPLYVDIYLPALSDASLRSTPVFMMHGGGFMYGERSDSRDLDRWLSKRGYTVFDVDYRLAPPLTWNEAAEDVACAMSWAATRADTYNIAPNHALVAGQSAGATLALDVAYGLGDGTVHSSCGGEVAEPVAVLAMYPADDMVLAWDSNLTLGPLNLRRSLTEYIGGSPEQFPDRYRATSPIDHVRPGLPPTLIAYGLHDHLVPTAGHLRLEEKLSQAGVPNVLLGIPFSDHAYDLLWGSIGGQITRQVASRFLIRYCPSRVPEPPQ